MFRAGFHRVNLLDEEQKTKYIVAVDKDGELAVLSAEFLGLTCRRQKCKAQIIVIPTCTCGACNIVRAAVVVQATPLSQRLQQDSNLPE